MTEHAVPPARIIDESGLAQETGGGRVGRVDSWIKAWRHCDGSPCDAGFAAPAPAPRDGGSWWCTEHQKHLEVVPEEDQPRPLLDASKLIEELDGDLPRILDAIVLEPGQRLILVLPKDTTPEELQDATEALAERPAFHDRVLLVSEVFTIGVTERMTTS